MKGNFAKLPLWVVAAAAAVLLALMMTRTGGKSTASQQEARIAEVLSTMQGAGRVEVALYYAHKEDAYASAADVPAGVLVVAEGADDMTVRLNLIRAVRTLLGLPENAVDVFMMEGGS